MGSCRFGPWGAAIPRFVTNHRQAPAATVASMRPTPYEHVLLADYAATLDALPLEIAKNIADLRELDGVLNNSMIAITHKLNALTDLLIDPNATPAKRFASLVEVAEEAARLKLGTDDKIRVVTTTADHLQNQRTYLDSVLKQVALEDPKFAPSRNTSKTTFPTLVFRPFTNPSPMETGRRRRAQAGNRGAAAAADRENPTPNKRRRYNNDDPDHRPTRRDRDVDVVERTNGRKRALSPADSLVSMNTSHPQIARPRPAAQVHRNGPGTPRGVGGLMDAVMNNKDAFASPRMAALPGFGHPGSYADQYGANGGQRWDDGAGPTVTVGPGAVVVEADGDGDADQDERMYCYCDSVSYGDMIACDGEDCPREWFHLVCTGLTTAPKGKWYCEDCVAKGEHKRRNRNTKRRTAGA
ncbi:hypothetical protein EXIGLDRAFT_643725, partial [Exidia glandulosa HHB12029]